MVTGFDAASGKHTVDYDDGDEEELVLADERMEWLEPGGASDAAVEEEEEEEEEVEEDVDEEEEEEEAEKEEEKDEVEDEEAEVAAEEEESPAKRARRSASAASGDLHTMVKHPVASRSEGHGGFEGTPVHYEQAARDTRTSQGQGHPPQQRRHDSESPARPRQGIADIPRYINDTRTLLGPRRLSKMAYCDVASRVRQALSRGNWSVTTVTWWRARPRRIWCPCRRPIRRRCPSCIARSEAAAVTLSGVKAAAVAAAAAAAASAAEGEERYTMSKQRRSRSHSRSHTARSPAHSSVGSCKLKPVYKTPGSNSLKLK